MMNLELARIVTAERRRATDEAVRQAGFRAALSERAAERKLAADGCTPGRPDASAGQGAKPALGASR
jgi:hypothetical protein